MGLMDVITSGIKGLAFMFQKRSPEIFMVVGCVGVAGAGVLACVETRKAVKIMDEAKEKREEIAEENDEETEGKNLTKLYFGTAGKLIKTYAPSVILGGLSIGGIVFSHDILAKRNVALSAAYTAASSAFTTYRNRVKEELGEDADKKFRYGLAEEKVKRKVLDEKTGKEKEVEETIVKPHLSEYSEFARVFDNTNTQWEKSPEYNLLFLKQQQAHFNQVLQHDKYLFLNTVYESLGFDRTQAGQVMGWIYDKNRPAEMNYVDFGIYDLKTHPHNSKFINGDELSIILDFNIDGNIMGKLEEI